MAGEKAAAMLLKQRPKLFAVGARHVESGHFGVVKKTEPALGAWRRQLGQVRQNLEQENVPVGASFVAVLTDEAGEVEVAWAKV